jgi:hypothetical protein
MSKPDEVLFGVHAVDRRSQFVWLALAALCLAAGLLYALVHLGLWHGVVKLS